MRLEISDSEDSELPVRFFFFFTLAATITNVCKFDFNHNFYKNNINTARVLPTQMARHRWPIVFIEFADSDDGEAPATAGKS